MCTSKTALANTTLAFQATMDMDRNQDKTDSKQDIVWLNKGTHRNFCSYMGLLQADQDRLLNSYYSKREIDRFHMETCILSKCFQLLGKSLDNYAKYLCSHKPIHSFRPNKRIVLGMGCNNK